MRIEELFLKDVSRSIDGVIKADDERNLLTELEEYVVTRDVSKGLGELTDRYLNDSSSNGVWISGFFGSGKSHLLKILSLVLDTGKTYGGKKAADIVLPKFDDEVIKANLFKAASIPSRSILFNIDQKFDGIGGERSSPILEVFMKVLNELQGYYGNQGYIAKFERDLDSHNDFVPFKETYLRINGSPWEKDRESLATVRRAHFMKAYAAHFNVSEENASQVMRQARDDYRVSIESFARLVKDYIDRQKPNFRLNFFVDEAGQFIGDDSARMLNLQTVAETLATVCQGRAWIFVTSQSGLEDILGSFHARIADHVTKIQGRFKTKLTLASADVREVIQKRLLAKKEPEPAVLTDIYDKEKDNFQTLLRFGDNSRELRVWRGCSEFCDFYPFPTYQFDLFQLAIQQLSKHGVFTGRYQSVGERSMLAVFQDVAKEIKDLKVGSLATFDRMYDGISTSIRGDIQSAIQMAERQLPSALHAKILKCLFLLKWETSFKTSARNIAILLIDSPTLAIQSHEKAVREALEYLSVQSYLQRNGDLYEFLTDTEKDIEVEIKHTDTDDSEVATLVSTVLFSDILREPKIRYEGNGQDYPYARKLDDALTSRDADVAVNIVTTEHSNHASVSTLAAQNTGKAELLAILPSDSKLTEQARLFLKTQKYIQQNSGQGDDTRKAILTQRSEQNGVRRTQMVELAKQLLSRAQLYLNGTRLESVGEGDARNRFFKACQELITFSFPSLKMLKGTYSETTLSEALFSPDAILTSLSEAEQDILTHVFKNQTSAEKSTLDDLVRHYGRRPYGWHTMAVLTLVARLFRMGKVELRAAEPLDAKSAFELMKNTHKLGGIRIRCQAHFDTAKIEALRRFHHDFFDRNNPGTDARSVGTATAEAFTAEGQLLKRLLEQASRYPFLSPLQPLATQIETLGSKDYTYLITNLTDFKNTLLDAKDDLISPLKAFMSGQQKARFDEVVAFLREEEANFSEISPEDLKPLRDLASSPHPYRGQAIPQAISGLAQIKASIAKSLETEKSAALTQISQKETQLRAAPECQGLSESALSQVLSLSQDARQTIHDARFTSAIRDRLQRYLTSDFAQQLTTASRLHRETKPNHSGEKKGTPPPPPAATFIAVQSLRPSCGISYISNEADLDKWLEALRASALEQLEKGNRITL